MIGFGCRVKFATSVASISTCNRRVAQINRVREVKRLLQRLRVLAFDALGRLKYCSPLGPLLTQTRRAAGSRGVGINTIRKPESLGVEWSGKCLGTTLRTLESSRQSRNDSKAMSEGDLCGACLNRAICRSVLKQNRANSGLETLRIRA